MANVSKFIYFLIIVSICLIFFQDIAIRLGTQILYLAPVGILFTLFLYSICNFKKFSKSVIIIYKKSPFKIFILYLLWVVLSSFFIGNLLITFKSIFRVVLIYVLTVIPAILFPIFILRKMISPKRLLQLFIYIYIFIMLYGIFYYLVQKFNLNYLAQTHDFFCTKTLLNSIDNDYNNYRALTLANVTQTVRAMSVFFEPSFYATFIFIFLPFIYKISESSVIIINNRILNRGLKLFLLLITWLSLFLTQSPIYIVLSIIYTIFYYYKYINKYVIMITIFFLLYSSFVIALLPDLDTLTKDYKVVNRIVNTVSSFGSLDKLVQTEPSLATRLITNYNGLLTCINYHPVKGTGYGNSAEAAQRSIINSRIPLTGELQLIYAFDMIGAPPSIFFSIICQTGIVGVALLYLFILQTIIQAKKIINCFIGFDKLLIETCFFISINYVIISFYWSIESYPMMWFFLGILNYYILIYKVSKKRMLI